MINFSSNVEKIAEVAKTSANAYVFLGYDKEDIGNDGEIYGIAETSTTCDRLKKYRTSISEWGGSDVITAVVC